MFAMRVINFFVDILKQCVKKNLEVFGLFSLQERKQRNFRTSENIENCKLKIRFTDFQNNLARWKLSIETIAVI